jgi:hypothetical protein
MSKIIIVIKLYFGDWYCSGEKLLSHTFMSEAEARAYALGVREMLAETRDVRLIYIKLNGREI